jgi:hypothetical protein
MKFLKVIDKDQRPKWLPSPILGTVVGIIVTASILALAWLRNVVFSPTDSAYPVAPDLCTL